MLFQVRVRDVWVPFHTIECFHFSLKYLCPELINANFEIATEFPYYLTFTDYVNTLMGLTILY